MMNIFITYKRSDVNVTCRRKLINQTFLPFTAPEWPMTLPLMDFHIIHLQSTVTHEAPESNHTTDARHKLSLDVQWKV